MTKKGIPMTADPAELARAWDPGDDATAESPYELWRHFRSSDVPLFCEKYGGLHVVSRYADVRAVMLDYQRFVSSGKVAIPPHDAIPRFPPTDYDPPEHRELRSPLHPWFSPGAAERLEPGIREATVGLLSRLEDAKEFDFVWEFAAPLPQQVTWRMIHMPDEERDKVSGWFEAIMRNRTRQPDVADAAYKEVFAYLRNDLEARRNTPPAEEDVITTLLRTQINGQPVSDDMLVMFYFLILVAGFDTTTSTLSMALWHLAEHPELVERLRAEPELIPTAIEEFLRMYSPVPFLGRTLANDTDYNGCPMKAGDRVVVMFGSANNDEREFPDADKFIPDRQPNRHLAFGTGIHRCVGSNIARTTLRIGITEVLNRLGSFRLSDTKPVVWEMNGDIRTISSLSVIHQPSAEV
jgi:cytochrome P450